MENLTGCKVFTEFLRETNPDGLEMKVSLEEFMLIEWLRNPELELIEIKKKHEEIVAINVTTFFTTTESNASRILKKYKNNGEVKFNPIGGDNYQVRVTSRFK